MAITAEQLVRAELAEAETARRVVQALNEACARFGIITGQHLASFLSQCSHESVGFRAGSENLNYSALGLLRTFPKYFDKQTAVSYARRPEAIANRVYGGRLGNGPEASGDGWRYRGRGFIQLTGKRNYAAFGQGIGEDVVANPDLVATPKYAALSAAWYWAARNLNKLADTPGIEDETRAINGGTIGLHERQVLYDNAIRVFGLK